MGIFVVLITAQQSIDFWTVLLGRKGCNNGQLQVMSTMKVSDGPMR